jgi:NAD+ synthase (glutamine-hydrolysing)
VTGYPPRDLLLDDAFVDAAVAATNQIAQALAGSVPVIVGTVLRAPERPPRHPGLYNALAVLAGGRVVASRKKRILPVYDVFHEPRWFVPGPAEPPLALAGEQAGFCICEDLWSEAYAIDPPRDLRAAGAGILLCASASPYRAGVLEKRLHHARRAGGPLVFVNAVGANDELIFDGGSFGVSSSGEILASLPRFEEAVAVIDTDESPEAPRPPRPSRPFVEELFRALVLGVRDFALKNNTRRAFLGLSGGIDSALVACIAAEALGPSAVTALALPSRHTDPRSTSSARELAASLGIGFEEAPIEPLHRSFEETLAPLLAGAPEGDTTAENIQARLRAVVLMAYVNRRGGVLLNTSNKTESPWATGRSTATWRAPSPSSATSRRPRSTPSRASSTKSAGSSRRSSSIGPRAPSSARAGGPLRLRQGGAPRRSPDPARGGRRLSRGRAWTRSPASGGSFTAPSTSAGRRASSSR